MGRCLYGCPRRPAGTEAERKVAINFFYNSTLSPCLCVSLCFSMPVSLYPYIYQSHSLPSSVYLYMYPFLSCSSPSLIVCLYICYLCIRSIGSSRGNISVHLIDWSLHIAPSDQASDDRNHYIHMYTNHRYIIIPVGPIVCNIVPDSLYALHATKISQAHRCSVVCWHL